MRLKVGIIGAGKRVRQTILPAILALADRAEVVGIHSRTPRKIKLPDGSERLSIAGQDDLSLGDIDVLIVAVGTNSILPVLRGLQTKRNKAGVALVMDTPPLNISHYWRLNLFKGFKRVEVGEDWTRLSPIIAAKEIIGLGKIGELRSIVLDRMGYRYHGMATVKTLASVKSVIWVRRCARGGGTFETTVKLRKNLVATMVEPRNYDKGRILISGTSGTISVFQPNTENKSEFEILYSDKRQGWYHPISINGEVRNPDRIEQVMGSLPSDYLPDNSPINLLKIHGYARFLEDIFNKVECYPISSGLYDYLSIAMAEKSGHFRDFSLSNSRNSFIHRLLDLHQS